MYKVSQKSLVSCCLPDPFTKNETERNDFNVRLMIEINKPIRDLRVVR